VYAVILAGGGGTRLWPLSRPETPKPFLPLLGDRSLLQLTVERIVGHPELSLAMDDVTVVTDRRYGALVREQLPDVHILVEPTGRNTAAAVALATLRVERAADETMVVLPADHLIGDEAAARGSFRAAATLAGGAFGIEEPLVTIGVRPDHPATEYGYLVPDPTARSTIDGIACAALRAFEEKPSRDRATELIGDPATAWNSGVFAWHRGAIRRAIERYTGLLTMLDPVTASEAGLLAAYDRLKPLSVDRAVLEGAAADGQVVMASFDGGWSDLGGWTALLAAIGGRGEGRVVGPGETAAATSDDLVVERVDGRLALAQGPREIHGQSPTALLRGAAASRDRVAGLIERVAAWEAAR
jgi:mannose-1-phosphate guanylyltransferase